MSFRGMISKALTARVRSRQSNKVGHVAEDLVRHRLIPAGFRQVQRIETGWRVRRGPTGHIIGATPLAKVAGDFRCVISPTGRSVLVEVKYRAEKLSCSDIEAHQALALTEHALAGGLSILAWFSGQHVFLMRWPIEGFARRQPLTESVATMRASDLSKDLSHENF